MVIHPFTYYGDLLGVSNFYRIGPNAAYEKLNFFYNWTYRVFDKLREIDGYDLRIFLFSDSIFVTGTLLEPTLNHLAYLYSLLFQNNLLLRGAMVEGRLEFDPRFEFENMTKQLPQGDVLFRAVELEKRNKGARLLIEKRLAQVILPSKWYTLEGYLNDPNDVNISINSIKRRIRTTPNWGAYELLWPLVDRDQFNHQRIRFNYDEYSSRISELKRMVPREALVNVKETKELFLSLKDELRAN